MTYCGTMRTIGVLQTGDSSNGHDVSAVIEWSRKAFGPGRLERLGPHSFEWISDFYAE